MSSSFEAQLQEHLQRHRTEGILLDTNVLLLLLIAQLQPALIGDKRLEKYTREDAEMLCRFVGQFSRILTTTHILAETSSLAAQALSGKFKADFFKQLFPLFCTDTQAAFHKCSVDGNRVEEAIFVRLGLTDASLVATVESGRLLLTDDMDLHLAVISKESPSINFTHMREAAGLL